MEQGQAILSWPQQHNLEGNPANFPKMFLIIHYLQSQVQTPLIQNTQNTYHKATYSEETSQITQLQLPHNNMTAIQDKMIINTAGSIAGTSNLSNPGNLSNLSKHSILGNPSKHV